MLFVESEALMISVCLLCVCMCACVYNKAHKALDPPAFLEKRIVSLIYNFFLFPTHTFSSQPNILEPDFLPKLTSLNTHPSQSTHILP